MSGYKVNRRQIIGKVDISSARNPRLVDQTNREGLRKCAESDAFIVLLQHLLMGELKPFLDTVDRELQATEKLRFDDIEQRVETHEEAFRRTIDSLVKKHPEVKSDADLLTSLQDILRQIRELMEQASKLAKSFEKGRSQLVHLAGLGLILESIAHELGRATTHTLTTLAEADRDELPPDVSGVFGSLESQLKTLQKRLDALDPLSTATRQTKEKFDLVAWVRQTLEGHQAQFERHGIKWSFAARPKNGTLEVKAVRGMFFQILENLITNSVYWLKQEQKIDRSFQPEITVVVHVANREIHFSDNGPGISPDRKDEIFEPFVTTKPPGEGKGLGLYISREIAEYYGAHLYLSDKHTEHTETLNTFVLALEGAQ